MTAPLTAESPRVICDRSAYGLIYRRRDATCVQVRSNDDKVVFSILGDALVHGSFDFHWTPDEARHLAAILVAAADEASP